MNKQVVHIAKLQTAKVMAVLYLVMSIPMVLLMALPAWLDSSEKQMPLVAMVMIVVLYPILGFIFTFIGAWVYNAVAARVGGIEFTTAEVNSD